MAQIMSNSLLNPLLKLNVKNDYQIAMNANRQFVDSLNVPPCDLHLVNLRTMQTDGEQPTKKEVSVIFHRMAYDDCNTPISTQHAFVDSSSFIKYQCSNENNFSFKDFFSFLNNSSLKVSNTFLTLTPKDVFTEDDFYFIRSGDKIVKYVQPIHIEAFRINF